MPVLQQIQLPRQQQLPGVAATEFATADCITGGFCSRAVARRRVSGVCDRPRP